MFFFTVPPTGELGPSATESFGNRIVLDVAEPDTYAAIEGVSSSSPTTSVSVAILSVRVSPGDAVVLLFTVASTYSPCPPLGATMERPLKVFVAPRVAVANAVSPPVTVPLLSAST
ncbi:MAG: hypothetical protein BWY06_02840 [Candidatus Latescibacteria bacterium ADurb.Bin168]|nr:MAG: hypothetical protein BWY06_02840 [Candidatus Latescibacteria bacterium ADurb.Bin168]